jgi:glycosyltransferase involved in cell wall biosynthesis
MISNSITVLMPVHGEALYLKRAIESVLSQTLTAFDFVIILDRASKNAEQTVGEFSSKDTRIKIIHSNLPGISNALNVGLKSTSTEYVARIDADDEMHPNRLQRQLEEISTSRKILCLGSQLQVINEQNECLYVTSYPTKPFAIKRALLIRNVIAHPSIIVRRESIIEAGMYQPKFDGAEDYDLWLRLLKFGKIGNIDEQLTFYRISELQETKKNRTVQTKLDSEIRNSNLSPFASYLTRKSALRINRGIETFGYRRYLLLVSAFFLQPITFLYFILFILFPRLIKK